MYEGTPVNPTPVVSTTRGKASASSGGSPTAALRGGTAKKAASPVINTRAWLESRGVSPAPDDDSRYDALSRREPGDAAGMAILRDLLQIDPMRVFVWLRTGWIWIVLFTFLGAVAGYGVVLVVKPRFTASADLFVDPVNLKVVDNVGYGNLQ